MSKRTLDRLADPMKGRYESPPKEKRKAQKMPSLVDSSSQRKVTKSEKMERTRVREARSEDRRSIPPVRYQSPIREDSPDENSCEEYSPRNNRNRAVERKDSDSFFLTGTMHGEVEIQSYHPVMDVRINVDTHHHHSGVDRNEEVYTSRTKAYLEEALQRSQTGHGGPPAAAERQKKMKGTLVQEQNFGKEIRSKKSRANKLKSESSKRETRERGTNGEKKRAALIPAAGRSRRSNPKNESLLPSQEKGQRERSRWGGSRDPLPVTKPVSRKLLAPVAGIQTKKPSKRAKKTVAPSADNLVGLERVDEGTSRDASLLRTNSSSAALRRTASSRVPPSKSSGSNLIGSRSAPTLSRRRAMGAPAAASNGGEGLAQIEETLPAYRVHAPIPSRLLAKGPSRRPPLPSGGNKSSLRLAPLDAPPLVSEASSHSHSSPSADKPKLSLSRRSSSDFTTGAVSSTASTSVSSSLLPIGSKTRLSAAGSASGGSSDDQLAALFAQHAKKLSENLEKASNLSMRYQHMKDYDGMTAAARHVGTGSLLPLSNKRSPREGPGRAAGEGETAPQFVPPERLSMII
jgi:hypothetical protein